MLESKTHASLPLASSVEQLCQPLFENTRIKFFSHVVVDANNSSSGLCSHGPFAELYLAKGYYNYDIHALQSVQETSYILWDLLDFDGGTRELNEDHEAFQLGHTFTIIRQEKDYKECFHFSGALGDYAINGLYAQYTDLLENFILYYKEKITQHRDLQKAYQDKLYLVPNFIHFQANVETAPTLPLEPINKYVLGIDKPAITKREASCLYWLERGKAMDEIALILEITPRTVQAHVESVKKKLGCYTLFQLGQAYHRLQLWRILL